MSREDLINNLGTIANSGSKKFVDQIKSESNNQSYGYIFNAGTASLDSSGLAFTPHSS